MTSLAISLIGDLIQNIELLLEVSSIDDFDEVIPHISIVTEEIKFLTNNINNLNVNNLSDRLVEVSELLKELSQYVLSHFYNT